MSVELINGVNWYYYLVPNKKGKSLSDILGEELPSKFIVCLMVPHPKGKTVRIFTAFDSYVDFLHFMKTIPRERWHFFEVILGEQVQKLYFDIEVYPKDLPEGEEINSFCNRLLTELISRVVTVFRDHGVEVRLSEHILFFNSNSESKHSYHIIIDGYAVMNNKENATLAREVLQGLPEEYRKFVDESMYSSKQQLRLFLSHKPGSNRPKLFMDKWEYNGSTIEYAFPKTDKNKGMIRFTYLYGSSCVTVTNDCHIISIIPEEPPKPFKYDDVSIDEAVVKVVYDEVGPQVFDIFNLYKVTGSMILLKRKKAARCDLCERIHENENAYLRVTQHGEVFFHCRRHDDYNRSRKRHLEPRKVAEHIFDLIPKTLPRQEIRLNEVLPSVYPPHLQMRPLKNLSLSKI